jgi:hypothetical protein
MHSEGQWFDRARPPLIMTFLFCLAVVLLIATPRRRFVTVPGLSAVDEAIGRATEMGKPILFVPGIGVSGESHPRSVALLGRVARRRPSTNAGSRAVTADVMTISQEIVKASISRRPPRALSRTSIS